MSTPDREPNVPVVVTTDGPLVLLCVGTITLGMTNKEARELSKMLLRQSVAARVYAMGHPAR